MADQLARIFGTEEDKVNCPFYYKIGACRHGERCSRQHIRPHFSQTLILPHMYRPPTSASIAAATPLPEGEDAAAVTAAAAAPSPADTTPLDDTDAFEDFYEEVMDEFHTLGDVQELHVVENVGDHMFGNVYVKFRSEDEAAATLDKMKGRFYNGMQLAPEYSPVSDFREARCRQFDEGHCDRGGFCNFMHLRLVPRWLRREMRRMTKESRRRRRRTSPSRSRSPSPGGSSRKRHHSGGDGGDQADAEIAEIARSGSEERRAKFAKWNQQRSAGADDNGAGAGAVGDAASSAAATDATAAAPSE